MRLRVRVLLASIIMCASAGPCFAQGERGMVRALGGFTFGTEASSILGGTVGFNLGPNVQIVGEIGRMQDVLPKKLQDDLDLLATLLSVEIGLPVTIDVKTPAFYVSGGLRYNVPAVGPLKPFVDVELGTANLSVDINSTVGGIDISREVEAEAGLEDVRKFLFGVGGGLDVPISGAVGLDVGYRFHRIATDDPVIHSSAIYAALRVNIR